MESLLITGANRGLGLEFARQYAMSGWRVFAGCRHPETAPELAKLAKSASVTALEMDVTDAASLTQAAAALGSASIDVLINGAGIYGPKNQEFANMDYAAWAEVLDVNTMGPLRVIEAFAEHVARSTRKLIVTITSGMGSISDNKSGGSIAYRTSKAAVNMVIKTLALELGPRGITCIVVNPGWVKTDMGGPGATLTPADSIGAMRRLIEKIKLGDSGKFFNYDGREYVW
jgi:NAD(P)-dependent dehydrogenase (short-subunit alcohol dehydrogenase family)